MAVLMIGGAGELGAPVAGRLHSDGYRVRVLARRLPATRDRDPDLEYVQGNLDDTDALRSALAGCAAVHLSARGGPTAESYDRVQRHGPARVAEQGPGGAHGAVGGAGTQAEAVAQPAGGRGGWEGLVGAGGAAAVQVRELPEPLALP
jgi:uncharacterized protein YbjT (DUF2867 family)